LQSKNQKTIHSIVYDRYGILVLGIMGSVEKPDIKSRLAALKNKRTKSILQNRKAVYEEASGLKSKHEEIKKLQDPIDNEESGICTSRIWPFALVGVV